MLNLNQHYLVVNDKLGADNLSRKIKVKQPLQDCEKLDKVYGNMYAIYTNPEFIQKGFIKKLKINLLSSLYSYKLIRNLYIHCED